MRTCVSYTDGNYFMRCFSSSSTTISPQQKERSLRLSPRLFAQHYTRQIIIFANICPLCCDTCKWYVSQVMDLALFNMTFCGENNVFKYTLIISSCHSPEVQSVGKLKPFKREPIFSGKSSPDDRSPFIT
jgi:hypothetical protein